MRLVIAGLLLIGGGLVALALVWVFYSPTEVPTPSSPPTVSTSDQQETPAANQSTVTNGSSSEANNTPPSLSLLNSLQIEIVRIGPDGSAVFAGQGIANGQIEIFKQNQSLAQTTITPSGEWVAIADEPLTPGKHLIIVEMRTPDGETVRADQAIVVELSSSGEDTPLVALVPMTDQAEAELIQTPGALSDKKTDKRYSSDTNNVKTKSEPVDPKIATVLVDSPDLKIMTLSWASDDVLLVKGKSSGGEAVRGSLNGTAFSAQWDSDTGDWSAEITIKHLASKNVRSVGLISHLQDADEAILATHRLDFNLNHLNIGRDGSEMVVIEKGDMLWRIAYRTYGEGIRYLDIAKRNQALISDPDLIYPAQIFALPEQNSENQPKN